MSAPEDESDFYTPKAGEGAGAQRECEEAQIADGS